MTPPRRPEARSETEQERITRERLARQLRLLPPTNREPTTPWPPDLRIRLLQALDHVQHLEVDAAALILTDLDLELALLEHGLERDSAEYTVIHWQDEKKQKAAP